MRYESKSNECNKYNESQDEMLHADAGGKEEERRGDADCERVEGGGRGKVEKEKAFLT